MFSTKKKNNQTQDFPQTNNSPSSRMAAPVTRMASTVEMKVINECTNGSRRQASTSAPTPTTSKSPSPDETQHAKYDEKIDKVLQRRSTGSRKQTKKRGAKRMGSSSSLHSLVSILKPPDCSQRSVSNVSFGHEYGDAKCEEGTRNEEIDIDENSAVNVARGSLSTTHSTIGFRASFFSLLDKLGVYRSQEIYKPTFNAEVIKPSTDRRTTRNSITSLYFRKIYGENERRIRSNDREYNSTFHYANNYIKTSKYSLLTFLPLNLLEQFQRLANFYFLCLLILQLIPAISSLTPVTTAIPLIGVLSLTAIKDAYDDLQRHVSDSQVNNRISKCLRNGKLVNEKWSGVQVGDIIRMDNDQFVAADLLLLSSSEPNGLCFIETAELDGETNLKIKQCLPETAAMGEHENLLWAFNGEIICEPPNNLLNKFEGTLIWRNQRFPLDNEKILLRGCVLRNTKWCYGLVIFAGKDTKLMQNSGKATFKRTNIDKLLNYIIIGIVFFLLSICGFCTIGAAIWEALFGYFYRDFLPWDRLVVPDQLQGATVIGLLVFFSYAIVLNTVVPISLYVSVEVIRFAQSFQINWDEKMYHKTTKTYAKARTTTLNEELGQIQYIFSDKTGTLTQNIMTFNKCSIAGRSYGEVIDLKTGDVIEITESTERIDFSSNPYYEAEFKWFDRELLNAVRSDEDNAHRFFRLLALCHTVMPDQKDDKLEYQAQSPDEAALVSAARNFGFVFKSRTPNSITIDVRGQTEEYELLYIIDFNNTRKRMSVILRRNNRIFLYCKGADNVIYERLGAHQNELKMRTQEHLNKFASEGLRTLVLAERTIDDNFFNRWRRRQQEAALASNSRESKLEAIYEEIECDMKLVGVTAIEDKLQDGVPETIANLQMAGIKIWVLTGDKQETAINIGYSCQLLTDDMADVFIVDGTSKSEVEMQLRKFKESIKIVNTFHPPGVQNGNTNGSLRRDAKMKINATKPVDIKLQAPPAISIVTFSSEADKIFENSRVDNKLTSVSKEDSIEYDENSGFAIVVNGHSLVYCLTSDLEQKFLEIVTQCKAVICCRVTPLQKAMVVSLMKRFKNAVTLAIGDGANDVSMIKEAHIGVGISGQEGMQAVLASDYSIAQFRFLERLLLVHGRWSYYRMCKFLRYFFYKNFAFTLCHFWYAFFCGFSAQTVFDPMFISVYNLFYTALPVLGLGIFEQDVSDKLSVEYPKLYTPGLTDALFNTREFVKSVMHGVFSSMVLFTIPYATYYDTISPEGHVLGDHMLLGTVIATILIVDNTVQIALDTSYWTICNHIMIWGSLLWYFTLDSFYNYIIGGPYVGSLAKAVTGSTFWLTTFLTVIILMCPVLAWRFYVFDCHPCLADLIRLKGRRKKKELSKPVMLRTPSARKSRRSLRSSYAFAHEEGFGRLITSGKIMRKLPQDFAFPLGLGSNKKQNSIDNSNGNGVIKVSNRVLPGSSNSGDLSPRAPLAFDLDTINL